MSTTADRAGADKRYGDSVRIPKAAQLVAAVLRRQIIRGVIGDHEPLPSEVELMRQFAVSRPTLREALRVLESENLISVRRGARGGAIAHQIRPDLISRYASLLLESRATTLADVYQAQIVFEPACVRDLAAQRRSGDLDTLRRALEEEISAAGRGDADARARVGFHYTLIELTGNQTLVLLAQVISDVLISAAGESPVGLDREEAMRDHAELIRLIEARDAEGAHDLWRAHIERARRRVLSDVGGDRRVHYIATP